MSETKKDNIKFQVLENFGEEKNNISNFYGYIRIGDLELENNFKHKKTIENAKVGISIYGIDDLSELKNTKKNIFVVIPALTGTAKVFSVISSQGDGWANTYGEKGNILDPNENIIIGLDYFGGPYDSSAPDKHSLEFYPVPPHKQVEAWKKALLKLGVKNIFALFGGSNGGGHIHNWLFEETLIPKKLIPIAGPVAPTEDAKEFFRYQIGFLKYREDICYRLEQNLNKFLGQSKIYDYLIESIQDEILECIENWNNKKAIKIAREIGFLRFLNPSFFDKFYFDKTGVKLTLEEAKQNVAKYFENEGVKFEQRFSISSLILLSEGIAHANRLKAEKYTKLISESVDLIIVSIEDDNLFDAKAMNSYFEEVKNFRKKRGDSGKTKILMLPSNENTKKAGHDAFLWPEEMQIISDMIKKGTKTN